MKSTITGLRMMSGLLAMATLAGCQREATGQVAAVVNDEEITLQEINAELAAAQVPADADRKVLQQAALQRIIERRLAAQVAKKDGIPEDPEYLMRKRQMDEVLMVQMLAQKLSRTVQTPDTAAVDRFVTSRPSIFADRTLYKVDRITFPFSGDPASLKDFAADHSMADVVNRLNTKGIKFQRSEAQMDSAVLPAEVLARIKALPAGEPFLTPEGQAVSVGVVVGTTPAPLTGEDARPLAVQLMRNEAVGKTLAERLKAAKAAAKIEYQAGMAPTAAANGASAAGNPAKP